MKKIIIFSPNSGWGGGEKSLYNFLIKFKNNENFQIYLILPEYDERLNFSQIKSYYYPVTYLINYRKVKNVKYIRNFIKIIKLIKNIKPDYFYFNGLYKSELLILLIKMLFPELIIILHIRNIFFKMPFYRFLAIRISNKKIFISKFVKQSFKKSLQENSKVIYNIQNEIIETDNIPFYNKTKYQIGIFSRISPEKGQLDFIQIAKKVIDSSKNFMFNIYGSTLYGSEDYYKKLEKYIKEHKIESYIKFHGYKKNILEEILKNDAILVCSHFEPFGRVIIEAMACGRIVLSYDYGGPSEIIKNGFNGFLIEYKNIDGFAKRLLSIPSLPASTLIEIYQNSINTVKSKYNYDSFYRLFKELLNGD